MARHREQPPRQVLPADGRRPPPTGAASRAVESCVLRRHRRARGRMKLVHRATSIARWLIDRDQAEAELADELQTFLDMAAADYVRDGATPAEARRLAMLQLGGMEPAKERV